jgi:glycosyltransferase involved in cell wall biosynthesis
LARHLRIARDDIDLLHVEMAYHFGTAAAIAARVSGWTGPLAITPMGEDTLVLEACHYGFRRYAVPRRLVAWTLRQATGLRCISPLHERYIAMLAPETPRRIIPLNVSQAFVAAAHESPEARAARRRDARAAVDAEFQTAGRPLVLSLGRLHPFKGIDVLIGAMRQVPDATLLIAGPSLHLPTGDEASRLRGLVERWDLGNRTHFLGPVASGRALQLLAAASAVAVPSRLESLNKVCVEAAAVGTPFVVTGTTGISAWAHDFEGASVVPAGDEAAFADGLRSVIDRSRPADAGQTRRFVDQFSPGTVATAVLDFYQDLTRADDA